MDINSCYVSFSLNLDSCYSVSCKYGGTCQVEGSSYRCICMPGYVGRDCGEGKTHNTFRFEMV